tara:strand:- start:917 stop:1681 length:765 start_codon:yes stop_codon:yes gene_type:complete
MADRIPLIVNTAASQIQELATTDNLALASKLLVTNSTDSTSKDTGSTIIDGGVGIEKNLHVGGTGTFTGNVTAPTFVGNLNGISSNATLVDLNNDTGTTYRQLIFTSSNAATTGAQLLVDNTSSGQGIQYRPSDNTLRVDGDIIAFHSSDIRVKKNLEKIKDPIAKIMGISGYTFDYEEEDNESLNYLGRSESDTGVIAQEIDNLGLPGLIQERSKGLKAVSYQKLIPLLIEAIKELKADIDQLKIDFIRHNHD